MDYGTVRSIHLACVTASITLFVLRGLLQIASVNWRRWRWLRIVPHLNDTVLLAAASLVMMCVGLTAWVYLHHHWPAIGRSAVHTGLSAGG